MPTLMLGRCLPLYISSHRIPMGKGIGRKEIKEKEKE
jgi:hypothetical protein